MVQWWYPRRSLFPSCLVQIYNHWMKAERIEVSAAAVPRRPRYAPASPPPIIWVGTMIVPRSVDLPRAQRRLPQGRSGGIGVLGNVGGILIADHGERVFAR